MYVKRYISPHMHTVIYIQYIICIQLRTYNCIHSVAYIQLYTHSYISTVLQAYIQLYTYSYIHTVTYILTVLQAHDYIHTAIYIIYINTHDNYTYFGMGEYFSRVSVCNVAQVKYPPALSPPIPSRFGSALYRDAPSVQSHLYALTES